MKAVRPVIASNIVPYFQMTLVGSHSVSEREKKGKVGRLIFCSIYLLLSMKLWTAAQKFNFLDNVHENHNYR